MKEDKTQVKVAVPIRDLWKAMSSDIRVIVPKVLPEFVEEVELLEGDGGLGSTLLFKFGTVSAVPEVSYQKERIVELEESVHQISLEILEGGHRDGGYSSYTTGFKLTEVAEAETLIDVKVWYETEAGHTHIPGETIKATLHYIKCLENYLSKQRLSLS